MATQAQTTWRWPDFKQSDSRSPTPTPQMMALPMSPPPTPSAMAPPPVPRTPFPTRGPSPTPSDHEIFATNDRSQIPSSRPKDIPSPQALSKLPLTQERIAEFKLLLPSILVRLHWDRPTTHICYNWAYKNPKTAFVLYVTDNLGAWPVAAIFSPLDDEMMPFDEELMRGVVGIETSAEACRISWNICGGRNQSIIERGMEKLESGEHAELQKWEKIPFQPSQSTARVEKVRYIRDGAVYARKSVTCSSQAHKDTLVGEIRRCKELQHPAIVRIVCSYAQEEKVGVVMTPLASCNLDDYLRLPFDAIRPDLMRSWLSDLTTGLDYIHSNNIRHRNIKPKKFIIDGDRIMFSLFGITTNPPELVDQPLDNAALFYVAPEAVSRTKRIRSSADVFALGCILLEIMTVVKRQSLAKLRTIRGTTTILNSPGSPEPGSHADLKPIARWAEELIAVPLNDSAEQLSVDARALALISPMLDLDYSKRPKAKLVAQHLSKWNSWRMARAHGELDKYRGNCWGEVRRVDNFYASPHSNGH
ncbi:MAG: hypothetical protein M1829_005508 [Trizodia sp. TS-e1964]|nr:MAG: hypothetical protein M1829_005508 [Trizodia sp. TS-e1964]